jgi:hypothetical protein
MQRSSRRAEHRHRRLSGSLLRYGIAVSQTDLLAKGDVLDVDVVRMGRCSSIVAAGAVVLVDDGGAGQ